MGERIEALGRILPADAERLIFRFDQHPVATLIKDLDFRREPALGGVGDLLVVCPDDERRITFYQVRQLTGFTLQARDLRIRLTREYHATQQTLGQEESSRYFYRRYLEQDDLRRDFHRRYGRC